MARHPRPRPRTGPKSWIRSHSPRWVRWLWRHRPFQGTEYHREHPVFMAYAYLTAGGAAWVVWPVVQLMIR